MISRTPLFDLALALVLTSPSVATAGTLIGHLRDPNWYAQYQSNPFGVGYYEFAVNANATNNSTLGGFAATDVFGVFSMPNLPAGSYTVASWDVWWRPAYAFNVNVPAVGSSVDVDLRLKATMWGYAVFWDPTGYHELGQTFVASGPVSMIYLRDPLNVNFTRTVTVRAGGPGGPQVGVARTYGGGGDQRLIYGYGDMPTVFGQTYYVRIRTPSPATGLVLRQLDPRPDFSDPMPGGCLHLGNGTTLTPYPERDLGLVIISDDDGLITDLYTRGNGNSFSAVSSVGQTFIARGVNLISAAFWLADPSAPTYVVRLLENGPGGAQVGTIKRGKPARLFADPEMMVTWAPGECPLTVGNVYYVEVTRDGGGVFNSVYLNNSNPFQFGQAYQNGAAVPGTDLAGAIMEEESPGSAVQPTVKFAGDPAVSQAGRATNRLTIQWTTDVPSDSKVEYAVEHPPYTMALQSTQLVAFHSLTLTGLQAHTHYHYRVSSAVTNRRPAVSRDFVICTLPAASNLLTNPSFEEGTGTSPRSTIPGWNKSGGVDIRLSDGSWFWSLPPTNGAWLLQGTVNGSTSDAHIYQRVTGVQPGREYTFSAWVLTALRENNAWKYDVWNTEGRLIYMRLGIDPTGGTNAASSTVQWTPRMYSHRHYTQLAKTAVARSNAVTVFVSMKGGDGGQWHNYAVDDCALTHEEIPLRFDSPALLPDNRLQLTLHGRANRSNVLESSLHLTNWFPVAGLWNPTGTLRVTNSLPPAFSNRFYRARSTP